MTAATEIGARFAYRVYHSLLRTENGGICHEEIADNLGLELDQVHEAVEWLTGNGLLDRDSTTPVATPQSVLRRLFADQQERITELTRTNDLIADLTNGFLTMPASEREGLAVEVIASRDQLRRRLGDLHASSRYEVSLMLPTLTEQESLELCLREDVELLRRGVRYRLIAPSSALDSPAATAYVSALQESGAEIRTAESLPLRLVILDREKVATQSHLEGLRRNVVINGGLLAQIFTRVFEHSWSTAAPYTRRRRTTGSAPVLTDTHRLVLRMMAAGATDKSIARHLGYSDRTVRRFVADILRVLETDNRLTGMVRATRLGLLEQEAMAP
ncbi:LuxR C-terminal-related transcriptional regulator [Streptomyces sp. BE20]|uniref:LuxR C-terminal-related transcriptional regulator n=1 Tax=Streptomycetaceae TaxID=2062 RepID=UPI002E760181|nr:MULTISPECIES: LuxR C-terminal-related transcriptional regulator [unclassified Streptomyces]MED7948946.1 LuxR C-terminal-related transcriptional regulator [Streptomyces sp. BE303]MEE1825251.1 LuxR C-terminal-related transcriptional regulator [Streptomyces sp. BE20]